MEELGAFDERTGQPLPLNKVKTARARELSKMEEHEVKKDISWDEARRQGLKIVRNRWVDGWKPLPNDPNGVRSRCVAQEINDHERDDVFSGTPPLRVHRMILSAAATAKKVVRDEGISRTPWTQKRPSSFESWPVLRSTSHKIVRPFNMPCPRSHQVWHVLRSSTS